MMPTSYPHFPEAFTEEERAFALTTFILNGIFPGLVYSNHRIVTLPVGWYPVQRPRQTDDGQRGFRACRRGFATGANGTTDVRLTPTVMRSCKLNGQVWLQTLPFKSEAIGQGPDALQPSSWPSRQISAGGDRNA